MMVSTPRAAALAARRSPKSASKISACSSLAKIDSSLGRERPTTRTGILRRLSSTATTGPMVPAAPNIAAFSIPIVRIRETMIQTLFGSVEQEPSLLEKLKSGVQKTRAGLMSALEDAIQGKKEIDADLLDELEFTLISSDMGVRTTEEILERIRQRVERHQLNDAGELRGLIREQLLEILQASERAPARVAEPPAVILVV